MNRTSAYKRADERNGLQKNVAAPEPRADTPDSNIIPLAFGRRAAIASQGGMLEIAGEGGTVELKIRITPEGPVLEFNQAHVALQSPGDLALDCRNLSLRTSGKLTVESGADFEQRVNGGYSVRVRDDAHLAAQAVKLEAELGEVALNANDDVSLNGLRVLLNVPSEQELIDREIAAQSFEQLLRRPVVDEQGPQRLPPSKPVKRTLD